MADRHYELVLRTREPHSDELEEQVRTAAVAAAGFAARSLAQSEGFGESASVLPLVEFNVRTVPSRTPAGRAVVEVHRTRREPIPVTEDGEVIETGQELDERGEDVGPDEPGDAPRVLDG